MKLKRVEFKNFKLLDDVVVNFSTDPAKPLTAIRAENGSGKTSLLWGLTWAFYGHDKLPTSNARLTSTELPSGKSTTVQVVVDFEHDPDGLGVNQYRLTRSVEETPGDGDAVTHGPSLTKLYIRKDAGDEPVPGDPDAVLATFFPERLRDVFLTDGDRVQRFISGTIAASERQHNVHQAIRALLGLDLLEKVLPDLESAVTQFRKERAVSSGKNVADVQEELTVIESDIQKRNGELETANNKRLKIEEEIADREKSLDEIQGNGDLDVITASLKDEREKLSLAETDERTLLESVRTLFKSDESLSWALAEAPLRAGHEVLVDLYDNGVIPGGALGVLKDRLDIGLCICGESLAEGTEHRQQVQTLLDEQTGISDEIKRLTETYHRTSAGLDIFESTRANSEDFWTRRPNLVSRQADITSRQKEALQKIKQLEDRRDRIDEAEIQRHTTILTTSKRDLTTSSEEIGYLTGEVSRLVEQHALIKDRYESAQRDAKADQQALNRYEIATDLAKLVKNTLSILKDEHVRAVSDRMNGIFMRIVGSSPELAGAVFHGVDITEKFDIVVRSGNQRTLDTDYEVNGASQRALTLAFIWALMEVSGTVAPRVIDTPLGMTSPGVKRRMVEAISEPVTEDHLDYQVILLLTRSEIRDIEGLLDDRAGVTLTLSCSKDYPAELVNDWNTDKAKILRCDCSHRQFCEVCQRHYDVDHHLTRRT